MQLTVSTWNINSVRLRIDQVGRFLQERRPDVLCLQETKCPNDAVPAEGAAILRLSASSSIWGRRAITASPSSPAFRFRNERDGDVRPRRCAAHHGDAGPQAGAAAGIDDAQFLCPGRRRYPRSGHQREIRPQARSSWTRCALGADAASRRARRPFWSAISTSRRSNTTSGATSSCSTWSATRLSRPKRSRPCARKPVGSTSCAILTPEPEKIYSWWSYRSPDWEPANKGRRLDHIWLSEALTGTLRSTDVSRETRSWERPSDHVPVTAVLNL